MKFIFPDFYFNTKWECLKLKINVTSEPLIFISIVISFKNKRMNAMFKINE